MKKLNCHGKSDPKESTNGAKGEMETSDDVSVLSRVKETKDDRKDQLWQSLVIVTN